MSEVKASSHLVVVGASAGGIDALSTLVATLPGDFSAPLVIAQHLDPTRPSHLGDILGRRSTLPVRTANNRERLEPGVVYVVPSNRQVQITDSEVLLQEEGDGRIKPSIDLLLNSAAEAYGERLIAVILSGSGSDGAAGARAVKRAGGTVVIQDPETASYPGMPLFLAPTTVDIVANLERMGPILHDLIAGVPVPERPDENKELEVLLEDVRARSGLDFSTYKAPTIMRRLHRRIVATDADNLDGYLRYLDSHPDEYQQLISAFLINVTEFFRDPDLFVYLREHVLPDIISTARSRQNEIRMWSAGCATGEEAYSLAILLCEALGNELEQFHVRIFATDVDTEAIAFARRGIYPPSALAGLPEELINRYFSATDDSYQIKKRVRGLTVFGHHDLGQRAPFPNVDLILCRNVMIYFTPELQRRTLQIFAYSLRNKGYLVLGKAESANALSEFFAPQHKQHKVYRRQGERILMPFARFVPPTPAPPQRLALTRRTPNGLEPSQRQKESAQRARTLTENVLLRLPVGLVMVDRHYDIQAINGTARALLTVPGTAVGEDIIHLVQPSLHLRLRAAIDVALRTGTVAVIDTIAVEGVTSDQARYLQVHCYPQPHEGEQGTIDSVLIVLSDVSALVLPRLKLEQQVQEATAELERLRHEQTQEVESRDQQVQRLLETNRQLVEANQELTSANEELRATNEEFLVSTEEAQAATEEVETLNEELQATNEELETLNEELQSTIEELNTTNEDLNARSLEQQEMARVSDGERARLEAILLSMGDAMMVVNQAGELVLTNAAYATMFGGTTATFVARDDEGHMLPPEATPRARAARGESFSMAFTLTAEDGTRRWFEANGQPIVGANGSSQGGVVTIRDITERSLHRLQEEFISLASHELRTPLTPLQSLLQMILKVTEDQSAETLVRDYTQRALTQVGQLTRLIDDLRDVTRLQSGRFNLALRPMRLDEVVKETIEIAQTVATSQKINVEMVDGPLTVRGDAGRLKQVLMNLLTNAITYAPDTDHIDVRVRRMGSDVYLQVQDYGPGIPPADLPYLFSRFYQVSRDKGRSRNGLGLGLYIVKEVVAAHDGQITVASTEGQGTTFTVRLPLLREEEQTRAQPDDNS